MFTLSRRAVLSSAAVAPLAAAGAASPASAGLAYVPARYAGWTAQPAVTLDVAETQLDLFGLAVQGLLAGGTWPGTPIRFRRGEQFRVLVNNRLPAPTSIHWHGLLVPSLQDGVPEVTQLPIPAGMSQYYEFMLKQSGTYWYHSHQGVQEQAGLVGPLIIYDPNERQDYDHDEVVFLSDVAAQDVGTLINAIRNTKIDTSFPNAYTSPHGEKVNIDVNYAGYMLNGRTAEDPWTLRARAGDRIRLRLINGSGSSYFGITIHGMPMTVIAADGAPTKPLTVDSLMLATAQRYDVLVTVPDSGAYTIHAGALGDNRQAVGVIATGDAPARPDPARADFTKRHLDPGSLHAAAPSAFDGQRDVATYQIVLSGDMKGYRWFMNGNSWPEPFAGEGALRTYYDVRAGQIVRFKLINQTPMSHPMHLHGHTFRVLGPTPDGPADALVRDTVSVPPKQTLWIEFLADNPGTWFWHCHNIWHLATGMAQAVRYVA